MNGQLTARENMAVRLARNPYPGRGIVLGTSRNGRELIQNQFSTTRMLRNYIETMYVKVLEVVRQEQQDDSASLGR